MKKLIITLLFLLLSYSVSLAANQQLAWMGPVIAGCGTGTCTTSNDSKLWNPVTQPGTNGSSLYFLALKITLASSKTITAYKINEMDSGDDVGGAVAYLSTHDSGNNCPALTNATPNMVPNTSSNIFLANAMSDDPTSQVDEYVIGTPIQVASGTYWIVRELKNGSTVTGLYTPSTGDRVCYKGSAEESWTCLDDYMYDMELWGCD